VTSRRRRPNLPALVVLTVVWVLLWDHVSLFLVLTGLLLAVLIGWVFPLPPIELHGKIRLVPLIRLVYRLLADVAVASVSVVKLVFRPGSTPPSSIIRVQLRSRSDLYLT
jgi:multicomponent Na+:H+ antiporter subunit E